MLRVAFVTGLVGSPIRCLVPGMSLGVLLGSGLGLTGPTPAPSPATPTLPTRGIAIARAGGAGFTRRAGEGLGMRFGWFRKGVEVVGHVVFAGERRGPSARKSRLVIPAAFASAPI